MNSMITGRHLTAGDRFCQICNLIVRRFDPNRSENGNHKYCEEQKKKDEERR